MGSVAEGVVIETAAREREVVWAPLAGLEVKVLGTRPSGRQTVYLSESGWGTWDRATDGPNQIVGVGLNYDAQTQLDHVLFMPVWMDV
jgi:hypothetical protein